LALVRIAGEPVRVLAATANTVTVQRRRWIFWTVVETWALFDVWPRWRSTDGKSAGDCLYWRLSCAHDARLTEERDADDAIAC
jgi:hypothetical protein